MLPVFLQAGSMRLNFDGLLCFYNIELLKQDASVKILNTENALQNGLQDQNCLQLGKKNQFTSISAIPILSR